MKIQILIAALLSGLCATRIEVQASNDAAYQRYLSTKLRSQAEDGTPAVRHFNRTEWEAYCAGHQRDRDTCKGWAPAPAMTTTNKDSMREPSAATKQWNLTASGFTEQQHMSTRTVEATPEKTETKCKSTEILGEWKTDCKSVTSAGSPGGSYQEADYVSVNGWLSGNDLQDIHRTFQVSCNANWTGTHCARLLDGQAYRVDFDAKYDKRLNMTLYKHLFVYYQSDGKMVK